MEPQKRIVVNTLAQHTRSVINICLSLYSTRLVLEALGKSDYGTYALVAGVVALLGFITNALVVTTQRQVSFYHGKGDMQAVKRTFSTSLTLHIVIAIAIGIVLAAITPLLFNGFLQLESGREDAARTVYYLVILSLIITFLTAPYRGLFIARENIVYISIIDVCDGVLKLLMALFLLHYSSDRLIAYAVMMTGIMAFNWLALVGWSLKHFEESAVIPRRKDIDKDMMKELTNFAGWTIYSIGCIAGRNQGVAIVFNQFFGTIINAAYGIANQVSGSVMFLASALLNAISPQLIKAEGRGDRRLMLRFAEAESKYALLLLSMVVIPLVFEMPAILKLWLGDAPQHSTTLCRFILLTSLCDQTTIGLGSANQAIGRIRNYSLTVNTIKLLTLPAIWVCLSLGYSVTAAMVCYLTIELLCAMIRLPFLKYTAGLSIRHFVRHVFMRVAAPLAIQAAVCWLVCTAVDFPGRFLLTGVCSVIAGVCSVWLFGLDADERVKALEIIRRKKS